MALIGRHKYKILILKFPEHDVTHIANNRIGTILKSQEKFNLAIEYFKIAQTNENSEVNAQMQYDIAECYQALGENKKAVDEYLKVEYKYPIGDFWAKRAQFQCANLLEKMGKKDRALNLYKKLSEQEGREADQARERLKILEQYSRK